MSTIEIKVPDIGNYQNIPVIELLVKPGDTVKKDQGLVSLESDKATMEVPASHAGVVRELKVKVGDKVSEGSVIALIEAAAGAAAVGAASVGAASVGAASAAKTNSPLPLAGEVGARSATGEGGTSTKNGSGSAPPSSQPSPASGRGSQNASFPQPAPVSNRTPDYTCQIAVLGAGPGGYTAAFRAADLGQNVVLIERYSTLGGVCLNVGCIPSKALLHTARVIDEAKAMTHHGVDFGAPKIDLDKVRGNKNDVVGKLTMGLAGMAKQRKVTRVEGVGQFVSPFEIEVQTKDGAKLVRFEKCIIAAGSQAIKIPGMPWEDSRMMDSTDALLLADVPKKLLVIGGGIIGLEMACVYEALGSAVTVVELMDQLMPGADPDLVKPLHQRLNKRYSGIHLKTKVAKVEAKKEGLLATFEAGEQGGTTLAPQLFDRVLCAVGRAPNGKKIKAENAGVYVNERGFIATDKQMRTNVPHIFAIGDLVGQPMLAHKATHEGKVAAEVASGLKSEFVARVVPSVAYTDPEIAWVGVTELDAKKNNIAYGKGVFPHAASGRAIGMGRTEGFTKLIFDEHTHRIIGGAIIGPNAGDLISEVALAIEMGSEAADIGLTIHPHPTLGESVGMAAEVYEGTCTDIVAPKKR